MLPAGLADGFGPKAALSAIYTEFTPEMVPPLRRGALGSGARVNRARV